MKKEIKPRCMRRQQCKQCGSVLTGYNPGGLCSWCKSIISMSKQVEREKEIEELKREVKE